MRLGTRLDGEISRFLVLLHLLQSQIGEDF